MVMSQSSLCDEVTLSHSLSSHVCSCLLNTVMFSQGDSVGSSLTCLLLGVAPPTSDRSDAVQHKVRRKTEKCVDVIY